MICPNCHYQFTVGDTTAVENSRPSALQGVTASILDGYSAPEPPQTVSKAVPVVSERRERYKNHQLTAEDISTPRKLLPRLPRQDTETDNFYYNGEKLFTGPGIEQEL